MQMEEEEEEEVEQGPQQGLPLAVAASHKRKRPIPFTPPTTEPGTTNRNGGGGFDGGSTSTSIGCSPEATPPLQKRRKEQVSTAGMEAHARNEDGATAKRIQEPTSTSPLGKVREDPTAAAATPKRRRKHLDGLDGKYWELKDQKRQSSAFAFLVAFSDPMEEEGQSLDPDFKPHNDLSSSDGEEEEEEGAGEEEEEEEEEEEYEEDSQEPCDWEEDGEGLMPVHLAHSAPSRSSSHHFNTTPTATNEERHRRKRGGEINRFSEQEIKRWSKARVRAWLGRRTNPDQYYYRFPDLGVRQRTGKWSKDEYQVFLKRHHEFKLKGWWVGSRWGIFSATPGLEHRVGYQCSNLYRRLVKENILHDPSYGLDSTGQFGLIGGIPDGASDVPPEMHVLNTEAWNGQSAALEQKVDRWVRLYHPGEAPIGFVRFMRHQNFATRRNGRGSRRLHTNLPPFLHHFSSTAEKLPDIEEYRHTPSPTSPQSKSTTTTTKSPNTKRSPTHQLTPTSTASTTPKRKSPSRPPFAQIDFSTEETSYQLQRDLVHALSIKYPFSFPDP